jgi:hypothetical protein
LGVGGTLDVNDGVEVAVYRKFVTILKNDNTLKRIVHVWRTWEDVPGQHPDFGIAQCPPGKVAVRITPTNGPDEWLFPGSFRGVIFLQIDFLIRGSHVNDPLNFWWLLKRGFYSTTYATLQTNVQALTAVGAYTGQPLFSQLQYQGEDPSFWSCRGLAKIETQLNIGQ